MVMVKTAIIDDGVNVKLAGMFEKDKQIDNYYKERINDWSKRAIHKVYLNE